MRCTRRRCVTGGCSSVPAGDRPGRYHDHLEIGAMSHELADDVIEDLVGRSRVRLGKDKGRGGCDCRRGSVRHVGPGAAPGTRPGLDFRLGHPVSGHWFPTSGEATVTGEATAIATAGAGQRWCQARRAGNGRGGKKSRLTRAASDREIARSWLASAPDSGRRCPTLHPRNRSHHRVALPPRLSRIPCACTCDKQAS